MKHFFLKLNPPRPTFAMTMTDAERQLMQAHVVYWQGLTQKGLVVAFGPVADPAGGYGVAIVELPDDADAEALGAGDPTIQADVGFRYDVHPMPRVILRN